MKRVLVGTLMVLSLGVPAYANETRITTVVNAWSCRMEPSQTIEGYEIIAYPPGMAYVDNGGFTIPCPK